MYQVPSGSYQEDLGDNPFALLQNLDEDPILLMEIGKNRAKTKFPHIGYIVCPKAKNSFIAIATFIALNIVLTARHTLNDFACNDLELRYNDELTGQPRFLPLALLEDGAKYRQDYVLLYVYIAPEQPIMLTPNPIDFTIELPKEYSTFNCIYLNNKSITLNIITAQVPKRPPQQILLFNSPLGSRLGFSGAPYIDENGVMFGFHLSGYNVHSMWRGIKTGISLGQLSENVPPNSFFYKIIMKEKYILPSLSLYIRYNRHLYFFDRFTLSLPSLGQIDETYRTSALGATPALDSLTGTQVLLRYFLKDKTRFSKTNPFPQDEKDFLSTWKREWKKYTNHYFSYRDARSEVTGDYWKLYQLLQKIQCWEIMIKMPQNGNLNNTQHEWRPLSMKKSARSTVAGVQMGHKMGAVDYWAYGAGKRNTPGWLRDERIPQLQPPKYNTPAKINEKITLLENRYSFYRNPGHLDYSKPQNISFMKESWNYHFQWWQINQRDGRIAGQKTNYKNHVPAGLKWKDEKLVKR